MADRCAGKLAGRHLAPLSQLLSNCELGPAFDLVTVVFAEPQSAVSVRGSVRSGITPRKNKNLTIVDVCHGNFFFSLTGLKKVANMFSCPIKADSCSNPLTFSIYTTIL